MQVAATIAYNGATNTATLTPTSPLAYSTTYTVTVRGRLPGRKRPGRKRPGLGCHCLIHHGGGPGYRAADRHGAEPRERNGERGH